MTRHSVEPLNSIATVFEARVDETPDADAISFRGHVHSFSSLNNHANQLANTLLENGIEVGDRIGIDAQRTDWFIIGILAILKIRCAYVPLDAGFPQSRLKYMIEDCGLKAILCQTNFEANFENFGIQLIKMDAISYQNTKVENPAYQSEPQDSAYIMYTSGSTGQPKGVDILNRGVTHLVCNPSYVELGHTQRHLQLAPNGFDAATFEIWGALLNGGCCILYPDKELSIERLDETINKEKISVLWLTSSLFNTIIDTSPLILRNVAQLLIGGEALSISHVKKALDVLSGTRLINGYGPTEATTFTCCYDILHSDLIENVTVPIGKAINKAFIKILNADSELVPIGAEGELHIGGHGIARGYINKPSETANSFISYVEADLPESLTLYRTGDKVRELENGNIEFLGRIDQQVKIRGYRVEPSEVEAVLQQKTCYKNSAIVAYKTRAGTMSLAAFIVPDQKDTDFEETALIKTLAEHLPKHCLPEKFIQLEKLPLTVNGKLDRQMLKHRLESNAPSALSPTEKTITATEKGVIGIWQKILKEPAIQSRDNFFQMGGNSLQAIQVISAIKKQFGVEISLGKLFESKSLRELAKEVDFVLTDQHQIEENPALSTTEFEASFGQHQMWLEHQYRNPCNAYNVPFVIEFDGDLNLEALQKSLDTIFNRHPMLRASFRHDGNKLYVNSASEIPLPPLISSGVINLQPEMSRVFSLSSLSPPVTLTLSKVSENKHALLLNFHHILIDEWSIGIFIAQLQSGYEDHLVEKKHGATPEHTGSYQSFSERQRDDTIKGIYASQIAYWSVQLNGVNPALSLNQKIQTNKKTSQCERVKFRVPNTLTQSMKQYATTKGTSFFTLLLSLYGTLLANSGCGNDFTIGTPVSLRENADVQNTIGYFLNTLVIRMRPEKNQVFSDFLSDVHNTLIDAIKNKDVPLVQLIKELSPTRDTEGRPFFQTLFSLQRSFKKDITIPNCETTLTLLKSAGSKCNLSLQFTIMPDGLIGEFEYDPSIFDADYIEELAQNYQKLISTYHESNTLKTTGLINGIHTSESTPNLNGIDPSSSKIKVSGDFELALMQSWKKTLNIDIFDPSENFFDLGGNSLSALKLVSEVKKATNIEINLADIFRAQTFVKLRDCLEQTSARIGDLNVKLQSGTSEDKNLICLHGVTYYQNLAMSVGPEFTVYGLLAKEHQEAINSIEMGHKVKIDIDMMSNQYVALVRSVQPTGPYNLLGHSFGGFVAFEVAKKLTAQGETIENLFLIDTLLPGASYPHWYQNLLKAMDILRNGGLKKLGERIFAKLSLNAGKTSRIAGKPFPLNQPIELAKQTRHSYQHAMRGYRPTVFDKPASTLLVRAHETSSSHSKKHDFGWGHLLRGRFVIKDVDGDHLSCTEPPNISHVARHIRAFFYKE